MGREGAPGWAALPLLVCAASMPGNAQPNTELSVPVASLKPDDSGWISLFDGQSLAHFTAIGPKVESNGQWREQAVPNEVFTARNGALHATGSSPRHVIHKQNFTAYHFRMEYRFVSELGNAGMLYHVRLDGGGCCAVGDTLVRFPRSIENQGKHDGIGDAWTIGNVTLQSRVAGTASTPYQYKEGGTLATHGDAQGRRLRASANPFQGGVGTWNRHETKVWASDSVYHIINGQTVLKAWTLRFSGSNRLDYGRIALQSEGREMEYRNIRIKLFPQDPLYTRLYPAAGRGSLEPARHGSRLSVRYRLPSDGARAGFPRIHLVNASGTSVLAFQPANREGAFAWDLSALPATRYWIRLGSGRFQESLPIP